MNNQFEGELSQINPEVLIRRSGADPLGGFFLALGLIFNDIKGVMLLEELLTENFIKPKDDDVTTHAGNYSGILLQVNKLLISIISEFFVFLKQNKEIFSSQEFGSVFKRLGKSDQRLWKNLIDASNSVTNVQSFLKTMFQIRSNLAFHYDHSGKHLLSGYRSIFFGETKERRNQFAFYSIGETLKLTRYYFSDAAAEESMHVIKGKRLKAISRDSVDLKKYQEQVIQTITVITISISKLMNTFIKFRRNQGRVNE